MAAIPPLQPTLAGATPSYGAADNADTIPADGRTVLHVKNGSGGSVTVTVVTPKTVSGLAVADVAVAIPAGQERIIGPFPREVFGDVDGNAGIDYSATASVTRAAYTL